MIILCCVLVTLFTLMEWSPTFWTFSRPFFYTRNKSNRFLSSRKPSCSTAFHPRNLQRWHGNESCTRFVVLC